MNLFEKNVVTPAILGRTLGHDSFPLPTNKLIIARTSIFITEIITNSRPRFIFHFNICISM
jgi:hypothetical protein